MKEADYIVKADTGDQELAFENLRKVGIEEIQRLAGNLWTDYNIHDPGVTILEQLCFAITELGYKTSFDIRDLLASQQVDPNEGSTFYSAAAILEGKPVTPMDYRKLLIDRIVNLRDCWIEPVEPEAGKEFIKGLYRVLIKISTSITKGPEDKSAEAIKDLIDNTKKCLEDYSNLGEAFDEIRILDEVEIKVSGEIDLDKEANVEKTHALVTYHIGNYISSPVKFYTLEEMLAMGYSTEDIFDGPRLMNGFIRDEELKERRKALMTSQLVNIIGKVDGVAKVRRLSIEMLSGAGKSVGKEENTGGYGHNDEDTVPHPDEGILIPENKVAAIAGLMIPYSPAYEQTLKYYQNFEEVSLFSNKVIRYYRQIEKENSVNYNDYFQVSNDYVPQKGHYKPVGDYYSVQEQFPAIYALGIKGIPPWFDESRVYMVNQLKAYLLIFEQILTNYLAQLTNFARLFSLDEKLTHSYFPGSLETVPYIRDLLVELKEEPVNDKDLETRTREICQSALKTIDNFNERRHRVLDHLLARFGEQVSNFGFERFNYYYDDGTLQKVKIDAKINYLKELTHLTSNKARSFNPFREFWVTEDKTGDVIRKENISCLEKKIRIKLGIPVRIHKIAAYLEKNVRRWKRAGKLDLEHLVNHLSSKNLVGQDEMSLRTIDDPVLKKEDFDPGIDIDSELLRRGIWAENYKLISYDDDPDTFHVAFSRKLDTKNISAGEKTFITEKLSDLGRDIRQKPDFLRFRITAKRGRKLLIEFEKSGVDTYNPIPSNVWSIIKETDTREEAEKFIRSMTNFLAYFNINMEGLYLVDHVALRPRRKSGRGNNDEKAPEIADASFYSFRISIIFPDWPSRFADPEFRKYMESLIRQDAPAHIGINFYYLSFEELKDFEKKYSNWLDELKGFSGDAPDKLDESSASLVEFINSLNDKNLDYII